MTSDQDSSFSSTGTTGTDTGLSIPLSQYAKKSVGKVKQRYLEKISTIGIDPVLDPVHTYPDIFESATFSFRIQKYPRPHVLWSQGIQIELPVHTYSDSLRIHWGLTKLSQQALIHPGLTQNRRGWHCFPIRLSCFCRTFCPIEDL